MHSMSAISPSCAACVACVCTIFLLVFWSCAAHWDTLDPTNDTPMDMLYSAHDAARTEALRAQSLDAPHHHFMRTLTNSLVASYRHVMRISVSDLQSRHALEESIQIAAFEQFGSQKTGRLYNVSVSSAPSVIVQAMRLRSGSFRRYGVTINEFIIPRGCQVNPTPERVLLVYAQLTNTTLFQNLPEGYVLASPVLSVLVYDAANLNSSQPTQQLTVSTTETPIAIRFTASSNLKCASFDDNSTNVNYTDLVEGACQVTRVGVFALVENATVPPPSPSAAPISVSARLPSSRRSNTWKIVVGSVVGGFALLVLVSLLALGIANHRKKAKFAKMEYQAELGETLQTTTIRNSRVPAAGSTRTQSMIEREYSV